MLMVREHSRLAGPPAGVNGIATCPMKGRPAVTAVHRSSKTIQISQTGDTTMQRLRRHMNSNMKTGFIHLALDK